jgi:hypothetical protein
VNSRRSATFGFDRGDAAYDGFARSVLHVTDVEASLRFYVARLGFTSPWRFEEDGKTFVAQVDRRGCALILCIRWTERVGKGLMFISLNVEPETHEAARRLGEYGNRSPDDPPQTGEGTAKGYRRDRVKYPGSPMSMCFQHQHTHSLFPLLPTIQKIDEPLQSEGRHEAKLAFSSP